MKKKFIFWTYLVMMIVFLSILIIAGSWDSGAYTDINYTVIEDTLYFHDLRENASFYDENTVFRISDDTGDEVTWINYRGDTLEFVYPEIISQWIFISNSTTGNLTINATHDDETGFFRLPLRIGEKDAGGEVRFFNFIVKAVNDPPVFHNFVENITKYVDGEPIEIILNATDEEEHYPIVFDVIFNESCQLPERNPRYNATGEGNNCTLSYEFFNITGFENTSKILSFQGLDRNDTGIYNMWICANDTIDENTTLPLYRVEDYNESKQTCKFFTLDLRAPLNVEDINCSEIGNMMDNETKFCQIKIESEYPESELELWSVAKFTEEYISPMNYNLSWFYPNKTDVFTQNFVKIVNVTLSPGKREVGMWEIEFWAHDIPPEHLHDINTTPQSLEILINVTQSLNETPILSEIGNVITSINRLEEIDFLITDEDLVIPDKRVYNETFDFSYIVLNQSNHAQTLPEFSNLNIFYTPSIEENFVNARIVLEANSSEAGNYTINLTVEDNSGRKDFTLFDLTILNNTAPWWNQTDYYFEFTVNSTKETTSDNLVIPDLVNLGYAGDDDEGDNETLTFQVIGEVNQDYPYHFNLTENGELNFNPWKQDVGYWEFEIEVSDGYLTNRSTWAFNVSNINSPPEILHLREEILGSSISEEEGLRIIENDDVELFLWIKDYDFLIEQELFGNESVEVQIIIINSTFVEEPINFSFDSIIHEPGSNDSGVEHLVENNETIIFSTMFKPNKSNIGNYTITLNVSDSQGTFDLFIFDLEIEEMNNPPELINVTNLTSAVGRTLDYRFKAIDDEDGNSWDEGNMNFTFFISNVSGENILEDFLDNKTGEINATFNESHAGVYKFNITVSDSGLLGEDEENDTKSFWLFVYDLPDVNYEIIDEEELTENRKFGIEISANHTIGDELIYEIWMDRIIHNGTFPVSENFENRLNLTGYGNGTNLTLSFYLDFKDETYGEEKNMSLAIYHANPDLGYREDLTLIFGKFFEIDHENAPIVFCGNIDFEELEYFGCINNLTIGPQITTHNEDITINLTEYFYDIDAFDLFYNQSVNFTLNSNESDETKITYEVSEDWILTLSASSSLTETVNITGTDLDETNETLTNDTSNNFIVKFEDPVTERIPPPPRRTETRVASLAFDLPGPFFVRQGDILEIQGKIINDGQVQLSGISLDHSLFKEQLLVEGIDVELSPLSVSSLSPGAERNLSIRAVIETNVSGVYDLFIEANTNSPSLSKKGKITFIMENDTTIHEKLLFVEELITLDHPDCIEALESVKYAEELVSLGRIQEASRVLDEVVVWCKRAIEQPSEALFTRPRYIIRDIFWWVLIIVLAAELFLGALYFFFRKVKIKRMLNTKV